MTLKLTFGTKWRYTAKIFCKRYPISISNYLQNFLSLAFTVFKQFKFSWTGKKKRCQRTVKGPKVMSLVSLLCKSVQRPEVTPHLENRCSGVSLSSLHRQHSFLLERLRWKSLLFKKRILGKILDWKIWVNELMHEKRGSMYIFANQNVVEMYFHMM